MNNNWTEQLSQRMEHHEMKVPDGLWQDLEQAMKQSKQPRVTPMMFVKRFIPMAAALIILLGGATLWILNIDEGVEEAVIAVRNSSTSSPDPMPQPATSISSQQRPQTAMAATLRQRTTSYITKAINEPNNEPKNEKASISQDAATTTTTATPVAVATPQQTTAPTTKQAPNRKAMLKNLNETASEPAKKQSGWNVGAYAAQTGSSSPENTTPRLIGTLLTQHKQEMDLKHSQPIRLGVSVAYSLNNRLSMESGLVYTYLKAEQNTTNYHYQQKLHYLGIPLRFNYRLWSYKNFTVYCATGAMVEKCLGGKGKELFSAGQQSEINRHLSENRLQWSMNLTAGAQYNLTRQLGLYVEPGVSHYFDNHSHIQNIYKDSPTRFNLQLGLRFNP